MATQQVLSQRQTAFLLAMMVAIMPFSIDAYLPAVPAMAQALGVDEAHVQQSLSSFLAGEAMGVLIGGTLSDWRGRRPVALLGLAIYVVASLGLTMLQTLPQLLALRMVQALGAGMVAVSVGALVRDRYEGREAAQMFALIGVIMMVAPLCAPVVGWLMQQIGGWRAIFGFLLGYALLTLVLQTRFLPSTGKPPRPEGSMLSIVAGRYARVFQTRQALGFLFFQAFSFSSMFAFLTESPYVYMQFYHLSTGAYTAVFALNIISMTAFNRLTAWQLKAGRNPEDILPFGVGIQFLANLGLVGLAYAVTMPPLWAFVGLVMVSVGTQGLITANTQACFMSYFREEGGSANGVLLCSQLVIGSLMGFGLTQMHDGSARMMPLFMLLATVFGLVLLLACSYRVWWRKEAT